MKPVSRRIRRYLPLAGAVLLPLALGIGYWDYRGYPVPNKIDPAPTYDIFAPRPTRSGFQVFVAGRIERLREWRYGRMFARRDLEGTTWKYRAINLGDPADPHRSVVVPRSGTIEFREDQVAIVDPPFLDYRIDQRQIFYQKDGSRLLFSRDKELFSRSEHEDVSALDGGSAVSQVTREIRLTRPSRMGGGEGLLHLYLDR